MSREFNWNDLKFFVAVARAGNPNAAARVLQVDHNTVRRRVSALEADLGAHLFDRRGDHLQLTEAGEKLMRHAEQIENTAANVENDVAGDDAEVSGKVRLGVSDGLGNLFVAPLMVELRKLYPKLSIELMIASHRFDLSNREADMAISIDRPVRGNLVIRKLSDVTMRFYASRAYLDQFPPIEQLDDLVGHAFVSGVENLDFGPELNQLIDEGSLGPKFTCTSSVAQSKAGAVGGGLCVFAKFVSETEPSLEAVLGDQVALVREIWLSYHADLKELRRIRAVADFLVEAFERSRSKFS